MRMFWFIYLRRFPVYDDNDEEVDIDMKRMDAELKVKPNFSICLYKCTKYEYEQTIQEEFSSRRIYAYIVPIT